MSRYDEQHQRARKQADEFWLEQASVLSWFKPPSQGFSEDEHGNDRWFTDGRLNSCYLALDFHIEQGRGEQTALIYDSPLDNRKQRFSYRQLLDEVSRCAGMLQQSGVSKGDRIVIYMPMIPQAVIAMLASARIGAIHSVVFGGFAAKELAVRIDDAEPKVVLSASCGLEPGKIIEYQPLLQEALQQASHKPQQVMVWERDQSAVQNHFIRWQDQLKNAQPVACTDVAATDPLYILYTSGTTGKPKGVVRDNGGHAVAMNFSMQALYDIQPGDVFWAASDVGWVVGHSYIVYAPLIRGCTSILYEGKPVGTPDAGAFWRVVADYGVKVLFAAPTAFRAIKKSDPDGHFIQQYNLSSLQTIFMAGERLDPPTLEWTESHTGKPVIDHWWQTETGWAIAGNPLGIEPFATRAGSACKPLPGFNVEILDADAHILPPAEQGFIALQRPLPPGCLLTIWNNQARFESGYLNQFRGYYVSGDGGYKDDDGYLYVMGRIDDVINVAGHRLSTGEMEAVVGAHDAVAECAVIGIQDALKGQIPIGLVVLKDGVYPDEEALQAELIAKVRAEIGAIACFKKAMIVDRLPKTRSGKILRSTLRKMADGQSYAIPSTIDDPTALSEIEALFH
ncbi:MAG: propionyl-CoA synthetase [Reinekea sp.]